VGFSSPGLAGISPAPLGRLSRAHDRHVVIGCTLTHIIRFGLKTPRRYKAALRSPRV
jgi:hypothetical protein